VAEPVYLDDDAPETLGMSKSRRAAAAFGIVLVPTPLFLVPPYFWWVDAAVFLLAGSVAAASWQREDRVSLELHRAFLVVRSGFGGRALAACDIEDIRLDRPWRWSSRNVTVVMKDGERHVARSAGRGEGLLRTNFDRDLQRVREWWLANRDVDVVVVNVNRTGAAA
jgi:hypothetical protein